MPYKFKLNMDKKINEFSSSKSEPNEKKIKKTIRI